MQSLRDLPHEVLILIISFLRKPYVVVYDRNEQPDLLSLCLVSKQFSLLVQEALYFKIYACQNDRAWTIRALLRTVILQPSLASHVRELKLTSWRTWDCESDEWDDRGYDSRRIYSSVQNTSDWELFQRAVRELALPDKQFWRSAVETDVDEVYAALLILLVPNLRKMEILALSDPKLLHKTLHYAADCQAYPASSAKSLQRLEDVSYRMLGVPILKDITDLASIFRLPSMSAIRIDDTMISSEISWPLQPGSSSVKHMELPSAVIEPPVLLDILCSTSRLESLSYYHWNDTPYEILPISNFDPQSFAECLKVVSRTLKELVVSNFAECWGCRNMRSHTLGSLQDFHKLETLSASFELLMGPDSHCSECLVDVLPQSIKLLTFTDWLPDFFVRHWTRIIAQLTEVMQQRSLSLPYFRRVSSSLWLEIGPSNDRSAFARLIDAAKTAEVELFDTGFVSYASVRDKDWVLQ